MAWLSAEEGVAMELKPQIILVDDSITNLSIGKNALGNQYTLLTVPSGEKLFKALAIVCIC